jgi:hypothetical protein
MLAAGVNISGRIPILLLSLLVVLDRNLPYQFTRFLGLFCTFSSSQLSIALHRKTCGGRQRAECPFRQKKKLYLDTSDRKKAEDGVPRAVFRAVHWSPLQTSIE